MGKPAARMGDMTSHGGTVTLGFPTVLIGGQPAARMGDMHVCPMVTPPGVPHVGGPMVLGSVGVLIGGQPAARMGDMVTCVGPPDTIVMGCPTVLIGEMAPMGGGGAGGGAGGAGSGTGGAVAGAMLGAHVATAAGAAPEKTPPEGHFVEFRFVDAAGLPVGGFPFEYEGPDGTEDRGMIRPDGAFRKDRLAKAGNATIRALSLSDAQWSAEDAEVGDTVKLSARADGIENGTGARITICRRDVRGSDEEVEVLEAEVSGGKVEVEWTHRAGPEANSEAEAGSRGYSRPEYFFVVECRGCRAVSPLLFFRDWIEFTLKDREGKAVADEPYRAYLPDGSVREGKLDGSGKVRLERIPPGNVRIEFENRPAVRLER